MLVKESIFAPKFKNVSKLTAVEKLFPSETQLVRDAREYLVQNYSDEFEIADLKYYDGSYDNYYGFPFRFKNLKINPNASLQTPIKKPARVLKYLRFVLAFWTTGISDFETAIIEDGDIGFSLTGWQNFDKKLDDFEDVQDAITDIFKGKQKLINKGIITESVFKPKQFS